MFCLSLRKIHLKEKKAVWKILCWKILKIRQFGTLVDKLAAFVSARVSPPTRYFERSLAPSSGQILNESTVERADDRSRGDRKWEQMDYVATTPDIRALVLCRCRVHQLYRNDTEEHRT